MPFAKHFRSRGIRVVQQKLRAPRKQILFARLHLRGPLIFPHRLHRLPLTLANLRQQRVQFRALPTREQSLSRLIRALRISAFLVSHRQRVARAIIHRLQLQGLLQVGDRLLRPACLQQFPSHVEVPRKIARRNFGQFLGNFLCRRRIFPAGCPHPKRRDRKSTRLNSSHSSISYAVFCLKKKKKKKQQKIPKKEKKKTKERKK